jgi:hypothetical protein
MGRCASGCKGLEPEICGKSPACSYTNGEKRQFCRLRRTYKMSKSNCKVSKKTSKHQKVLAIQQFMKRTTHKRRARFLSAICSDSGFCYALGKFRAEISNFFNDFINFDYVVSPIVAIGEPSANGFVKSVRYERLGYTANAVLKSSMKASADNLAYEYMVGMYLNKMGNKFPCFVQTYGLYYYKTHDAWLHANGTSRMRANVLKKSLELHTYKRDLEKAIGDDVCSSSRYAAILIQHFPNVRTLGDYMYKMSEDGSDWCNFTLKELIYILYQIYMPLSVMGKTFTHYDLHDNNVLLYEPTPGKYVQYHYHTATETVKFKSQFIVKIIDYGRSFYKDNDVKNVSSTDVLKQTCFLDDCNDGEDCGDRSGFAYLTNMLEPSTHYMSSSENNPSADLRLLHLVNKSFDEYGVNAGQGECGPAELEEEAYGFVEMILERINFGLGLQPGQRKYGTKPMPKSGMPDAINNVIDAEDILRYAISADVLAAFNEAYFEDWEKICDIHVFSDGVTNMKVHMA